MFGELISITGGTDIGIDALVERDDGSVIQNHSEIERSEWVSAAQTRNVLLGDPVLDWLDLYGEKQGFLRDSSLQQYDSRTDFTEFMFAQARRFETAIVELLCESYRIATISRVPGFQQVLPEARNTFAEMCLKVL